MTDFEIMTMIITDVIALIVCGVGAYFYLKGNSE